MEHTCAGTAKKKKGTRPDNLGALRHGRFQEASLHSTYVIYESGGRRKPPPCMTSARSTCTSARGARKESRTQERKSHSTAGRDLHQKKNTLSILTPFLYLYMRFDPENPKSAACQTQPGRLWPPRLRLAIKTTPVPNPDSQKAKNASKFPIVP